MVFILHMFSGIWLRMFEVKQKRTPAGVLF